MTRHLDEFILGFLIGTGAITTAVVLIGLGYYLEDRRIRRARARTHHDQGERRDT